jgi:hypothetical protein
VNLGNKLLLAVCALALAALSLLPAGAGAAAPPKCPKGQTGTPPYCTNISNKFWLHTVKHGGTSAKIKVKVSGPGVVTASGKYLLTTKATAKSAGRFWLPLKLSKAGIAAAQKASAGKLKVRVTFVFTPTGGNPSQKRKNITFKA